MKLKAELVGMEELDEAINLVKEKAEELGKAIQRLNDVEITIKVEQ